MKPMSDSQFYTPAQMMEKAEHYALGKVSKAFEKLFALAIMAGVFIGLAFIFYITVTTGGADTYWGGSRLIGGLAFSVGLILVVLCGGELFTSSVLSIIAVANKQISIKQMLKSWSVVYLGNFIGAALLLALVTMAAMYQLDHGQWGLNALNIAQHKLHHTPVQAFSLGVLCNLLVCLAIWLTFSASNALSKSALMILPVALFVSSGFEHCIANMFMVPLGIMVKTIAPDAFWVNIGIAKSTFSDLTLTNFFIANLLPVTLGNIFGGAVLVGLSNWSIYRKPNLKAVELSPATLESTNKIEKENIMNNVNTVKDIMQTQPIIFTLDTHISAALDSLLAQDVAGAPVCDVTGKLVGFLSTHDILVNLWCNDYKATQNQTVADLMNRDIVTINAKDSIENVLEFMCIDKEKLYPTTSFGIATQMSTLPLEERAKKVHIHKPHILPVTENGKLVGVISRMDLMKAFRPAYGKHLDSVKESQISHQQIA